MKGPSEEALHETKSRTYLVRLVIQGEVEGIDPVSRREPAVGCVNLRYGRVRLTTKGNVSRGRNEDLHLHVTVRSPTFLVWTR